MNHTLTHADHLLTCAACAWRGVITSDGRILQTTPGDAAHDHVGQAQALIAERRAMVEAQLRRLQQMWRDGRVLPEPSENLDDLVAAGVVDPRPLSMARVRQYSKWIKAEHGA